VSYNGGAAGTVATPTAQERMAAQEQHVAATPAQHQHMQQAAANPALLARNNGGRPAIAATPHPGAFNAPGVVGAHGAAPSQANKPAVANRGYGAPAGAHPQPASGNGKPPASNPNVAKSHPKQPAQKKPAEKERHEGETAQR